MSEGGGAALGVRDTLVSLSFGFTAPVLLHVMFTLNYGTSPLGGVLIESLSLYGLYHNEGGWPSKSSRNRRDLVPDSSCDNRIWRGSSGSGHSPHTACMKAIGIWKLLKNSDHSV